MRAFELRETIGSDGLHLNMQRPEPTLGRDQVLIRVRAAALNYRDIGVARGGYGAMKLPVIPLSDGAGTVEAVGPDVRDLRVGDRVVGLFFQTWMAGRVPPDAMRHALGGFVDGMLAEYVALPESGVMRFPEHLTFEEASTLPCAALTAWHALVESGRIRAGETVAVLGTGGVAIFALQFAKLHGARVFVTSSSDEKLAKAKSLGAEAVINYRATADWDKAVLELSHGVGVDHVIEVGGPGTLEKSMNAVRAGGMVHVIGALTGAGSVNPRAIIRKGIRLNGINVGSREMFAAMARAIAAAGLRPVIDRVLPFTDAKTSYTHQASGRHFGKVVIAVQ